MLVILLYKAAPCAHTHEQVRIRALFLSPLKLVLQIVRQQEVGRRISTSHIIMYLVSHATRKPPGPTYLFSEEDNQTENQSHKSCRRRRIKWFRLCPPSKILVHISAGLSTEGTCPMIDSPIAVDSLPIW
jgi:hypothetical protein